MPRGLRGQKRPADVIGNTVTIARLATGEIEEMGYEQPASAPPTVRHHRPLSLTTSH